MKRLVLFLAALGTLVLAATAVAGSRDRNHDRIPDKWEKRHHLSLHVKQTRRDQDRDGLRNLAEYKARLDPRDDDTDGDGVEDGDEHAGTVKSYVGGVLTVSLFGGGQLSAKVTDDTEIECDGDDDAARAARAGGEDDDDPADDDLGDDHGDDAAGEDPGDDDPGDDDPGDDDDAGCAAALQAGANVAEAELRVVDGTAVWREIELR